MRMIIGRKPGEIEPIDLVDAFVDGCSTGGLRFECDYLDEGSVYVNLERPKGGWTGEDLVLLAGIAERVCSFLNYGKDDGREWVLYSEPNWWKDGEETEDEDEAETAQYMIYEEDKDE